MTPHVVYHVAGMGNYADVVQSQLAILKEVGLTEVRLTHVGEGLDWILREADRIGVRLTLVRTDPGLNHYETFAMLEIERLAKEEQTDRPILYLHTKGVSAPDSAHKIGWRKLMEEYVVRRWEENVEHLKTHHAVGASWRTRWEQHYPGNFWIASPVWIRQLPDFVGYHWSGRWNGSRMSCEMWIGSTHWCIAKSHLPQDEPIWLGDYNFAQWMPGPIMTAEEGAQKTFGELFDACGSDKNSIHSYGPVYDRLFPRDTRTKVRSVLEIGVQNGKSLRAWELAFPNAAIYGIDNELGRTAVHNKRARFARADAACPRGVASAAGELGIVPGSLDLIVDDGSHKFQDQMASALLFKPYMASNGTYIIEDIPLRASADLLAAAVTGGRVVDRRRIYRRFDDMLVVAGPLAAATVDMEASVPVDLPSPFA